MGDDITQPTHSGEVVRAKYLQDALRSGSSPALVPSDESFLPDRASAWDENDPAVQKAYLDQLVDCSPDSISVLDTRYRIIRINSEFTISSTRFWPRTWSGVNPNMWVNSELMRMIR